MKRVGLCFLDRPSVHEQIRLAAYAEKKGFEAVWVCETRLVRDAISVLGGIAAVTKKIKLGTGVINNWTRGPGLTAMTFATLDEMARGRVILGLGAYWDPLAWKQGIERKKPLKAMREYVEAVKRLFSLETVTYEGEIVKIRDLRLDLGYGEPRTPKNIPIYIGATGLKMAELAGEVADGILLNGTISVEYTRQCVEALEKGAKNAERDVTSIDRVQLLDCSMMDDGDKARDLARHIVALYLGQQPHVMKASGVKEELIREINQALGGWPPKDGGIQAAMELVDDSLVDKLTVSGTPEECRRKVKMYEEAGAKCPCFMVVSSNEEAVIDAFSE
jgi:5,10-methylenetetrahydromethanopterin reductase